MSANFGAKTDHWGLATTHTDLVVVDSNSTPRPQSREDALDENGDIADVAYHGNSTAGLADATVVYALKSGELELDDLALGQLETGKVILSIEAATSNGAWPQITVTGVLGSTALEQDKAYDLPEITIKGQKKAQLMGVTVPDGRLTDCTLSASCDWAQQDDGDGEPVAYGVSGAMAVATATAVAVSDESPALAAAAEWTVQQPAGLDESQAAWHTAEISVEQVLDVDITAPVE